MTSATLTPPTCPEGHGPMLRKTGRTGEFYSCGHYPACRRTAPVPLDLPCPQCGAPLVARSTKKTGAPFTGCSRWPTCGFATWATPHPCARCGNLCLGADDRPPTPVGAARSAPATIITGDDHDDDVPF